MIPVGVLAGQPPAPVELVSGGFAQTYASGNSVGQAYANAQPGDIILVTGFRNGSTGTTMSCASSGLTFTEVAQSPSSAWGMGMWYAYQPGDTTQRTVTVSSVGTTTYTAINVQVIRHCKGSSPIDGSPAATSYSATSVATTVTTTADNGIAILAVCSMDDNSLALSGTGWAGGGAQNVGFVSALGTGFNLMPTAGTTPTGTWTQTARGPDQGYYITAALFGE